MTSSLNETRTREVSPYQSRAVSRAMYILQSFAPESPALSVGDLQVKLGIPESTLVRLLECMSQEGFVEYAPDTRVCRLGPKVFELGSLYRRTRVMNMDAVARPYMEDLVGALKLSSNLAVRDGHEIVYVAVVEPAGTQVRLTYSVGDRFGLYHTALGKALIAYLKPERLGRLLQGIRLDQLTPRTVSTVKGLRRELARVRKCGYALDDEESLPGLRCLAAPIWSGNEVVAAISASGSTLVLSRDKVPEVAAYVKQIAHCISLEMGTLVHGARV